MRRAAELACVVTASLLLAYLLVRHSFTLALALVLVGPAAWVLTRRTAGLLVGITLLMLVPDWRTLGAGHLSALRVASAAALVTILVPTRRIRPCFTDVLVLAFLAVTVIGWLLQYDQPEAGKIVYSELTPVGFYVGARALAPENIPRVALVTLLGGTVGSLTVIYEYLVGHSVFIPPAAYNWSTSTATIFRPGGVFGGPPGASSVLCFVILFGVSSLGDVTGRLRLLVRACLGVCILALILTFTRAAFIGAGAGLILFLILIRSPILRPVRLIALTAVLAIAALALLPALESSGVFEKGVLRSGTLTQREGYWSTALPIVFSSPHDLLLGVGTAALETPGVSRTAPVALPLAVRPDVLTTSLHSQYITLLVEDGVLGLAAVVTMLAVPFWLAASVAYKLRDRAYASIAASLLAIAIVMSVDTALFQGPTFALLMVMLGLATTASPRGLQRHGGNTT
jgi:O-antigen ligase